MPNAYSKGQLVRCTGTLALVAGAVPVDPDTAEFAYRDGARVWHRGITPARDGTGLYYADVDTTLPATGLPNETWFYQFYSPSGDAEQAVTQSSFVVTNQGNF